ncbi:MAG: asparagine synthase C-terminal domain-containing protein [Candidatus Limnocylindria bacterium]
MTLGDLLVAAVEETPCEAILLSGGLDTSIVATLARPRGLRLAVTVAVGDAIDLPYATEIASRLGLEHVVLRPALADLARELPQVVRLLGTFDGMFLRNDVVVYVGLREVARRGARSCWTGDAADELFAGYSFVFRKTPEDIEQTVRHFARTMHFNGPTLGRSLGVEVRSPYLHPGIVEHAVGLRGEDLVLEHQGQRLGKAPLRRTFAEQIGARHAYRRKDPIEVGSGASALRGHVAEGLGPTFAADAARVLEQDRVALRDPEHLAYYRIYRDVFAGPPRADPSLPKECPGCHARGPEGTYCTVCGAYPI